MTNFELMKVCQGPMKMLIKCKIRLEDVRFLDLYEDFAAMTKQGMKVTYSVASLAQKYKISERKVYQLLKRMGKDCTDGAV